MPQNGSSHTFSIIASNRVGDSPPSHAATLSTWEGRIPQQPLSLVEVAHPSPASSYSPATSINVQFVPPYDFEQAIVGYVILIDGPR